MSDRKRYRFQIACIKVDREAAMSYEVLLSTATVLYFAKIAWLSETLLGPSVHPCCECFEPKFATPLRFTGDLVPRSSTVPDCVLFAAVTSSPSCSKEVFHCQRL